MKAKQIIEAYAKRSEVEAAVDALADRYEPVLNAVVHVIDRPVHGSPAQITLQTLNARRDAPPGSGTAFMDDLCRIADRYGLIIVLEPGEQRGIPGLKNTTSVTRLHQFYRRFGFAKNSGKRSYRPDLSGTVHREPRKIVESERTLAEVQALLPQLCQAAQATYDAWDASDEEFGDADVGFGGICQDIADAISGVLGEAGIECATVDSGGMGDQHVWCRVLLNNGIYDVDIAPRVYETGGGYEWKKIQGVVFEPKDVDVYLVEKDVELWDQFTES